MSRWEPKVVTFKAYRISEVTSKQLLAELAELFYNWLASSKKIPKANSVGAHPFETKKEVA